MPRIERVRARAFRIPTERPEADGTLAWETTDLVLVEVEADGTTGLGWTYGHVAAADVVARTLAPCLEGGDAWAIRGHVEAMARAVRNAGRPGLVATALSAVDTALWDLKARLLGLPLVDLLGPVREAVPAYASGGFTNLSIAELREALGRFVADGFTRVKMKVGGGDTLARVRAAREAVGEGTELFVDANGAWSPKEALAHAEAMAELDVRWLEEPVTSDDLPGLRFLRERAPARMAIAAGEYGYDLPSFRRMLDAEAVDVLQADVTRCQGVTGFLAVHALADARSVPVSAHTAHTLHAHLACALPRVIHVEHFVDHHRIEARLFDGALVPEAGLLRPDRGRPGLGVTFRHADAARFAVSPTWGGAP